MSVPELTELGPWLKYLSSLTATIIVAAAVLHLFCFFLLSLWYRRDLSAIAGCLDDFTRGLKHRSVLGRSAPLTNQIDAFVEDINDVVNDPTRVEDRTACLQRMHILDERRSYLDSLSFETAGNVARTMIEAYPLAGVLGTILAIGSALQRSDAATNAAATMSDIVTRFGDAIWSTFCGLFAAIMLMFVNSLLETRFERLTQSRLQVRDMVAKAKRELALSSAPNGVESVRGDATVSSAVTMAPMEQPS
ncbi:MAG: MotA/TolQ/ExbB proton channel family protein [Fuerstiella sp.]|nr:MotA/TolQ/ExbB proton channel family protein [Fuerstiella sp.]MCP4509367.1 MotA/TolQ/ExbB proton channel family protein [Fuerstiella sp.]